MITLTLALLLGTLALSPVDDVAFQNGELLHQPRFDGVVLTLLPDEDCELRVEYGHFPHKTKRKLAQPVLAGELATFDLDRLRAGERYQYQVSVRRPGDQLWQQRELHGFETLKPPGRPVRFAVAADTHAWAVWSYYSAPPIGGGGGVPQGFDYLEATMSQLEAAPERHDFVVLGTDTAMTKCSACVQKGAPGGIVQAGNSTTVDDAKLRYRWVLSEKLMGRIGADAPLLVGLGDHDGEQGWNATITGVSRAARLAHLPDPGYWFSVRTGDALIVMLNVHVAVTAKPIAPEDWTLGADQFFWLARTLAESDAPIKIVMAEHILGGHKSPTAQVWKARGGLRATDTGLPSGTFLGEQAQLHELLVAHDVDVFMSFHDHVVTHGIKDGVSYLIGGRSSGIGNAWINQQWYRDAMDYDLDGTPEFETDVSGTVKPGIFEVTVEDGSARFDYVLVSPDPSVDGTVLLSYTVGAEAAR
ncbi:MAG: hypothetical protein ACI9MC_000275 [Kiritimatiellia bacterium]|jgi:hypothetical protein